MGLQPGRRELSEDQRHLPLEDSVAVLLVVHVVAFVPLAVRPLQDSISIHLVVSPHAYVLAAVAPPVGAYKAIQSALPYPQSDPLTFALDDVLFEVALVPVAVGPGELAVALLDAIHVAALELRAVGPALHARAILCVILPEAAVQRPVLVEVKAEAVRLVVEPLALVDVTVLVQQAPVDIGLIPLPVALVEGAVGPHLDPAALPNLAADAPLSQVAAPVREADHRPLLPLLQLVLHVLAAVDEWAVLAEHFLRTGKPRSACLLHEKWPALAPCSLPSR